MAFVCCSNTSLAPATASSHHGWMDKFPAIPRHKKEINRERPFLLPLSISIPLPPSLPPSSHQQQHNNDGSRGSDWSRRLMNPLAGVDEGWPHYLGAEEGGEEDGEEEKGAAAASATSHCLRSSRPHPTPPVKGERQPAAQGEVRRGRGTERRPEFDTGEEQRSRGGQVRRQEGERGGGRVGVGSG